jgi:hypothetical protein
MTVRSGLCDRIGPLIEERRRHGEIVCRFEVRPSPASGVEVAVVDSSLRWGGLCDWSMSWYSPRHFPARIPGSTNVAGMNETFVPAFDQE